MKVFDFQCPMVALSTNLTRFPHDAQCSILLKGSGKNSITCTGQKRSGKNQLYSVPLTLSLHHAKGKSTQTYTSMTFGQCSEI